MPSKSPEEARLTRYLLGEVSDAERERLEEAHFADDDAFEQMLVAEDELIDAYARGQLSADERRRFEETFLASPLGRERVQFARTLNSALSDMRPAPETPEPTPAPPRAPFFNALFTRGAALRFALPVAAVLLFVGVTWLLFERARMREELRQVRAERTALGEKAQELERRAAAEQARSADALARLEAERARPTPEAAREGADVGSQPRPPQKDNSLTARRPPAATPSRDKTRTTVAGHGATPDNRRTTELPLSVRDNPTVVKLSPPVGSVSFVLTPGQVRGGGANPLAVPRKATSVSLTLNLEADAAHETYRAVIETAEGRQVWRADSVAGAGATVNLPAVPARDLPPGDYVLSLSGRRPDGGFEGVADYSFRIVKK